MRILMTILSGVTLLVVTTAWYREDPQVATSRTPSTGLRNAETHRQTVVDRLSPLSFVAGDWKGVSQPKRGSNSGAWSEKAHAAWSFDGIYPCLIITLQPGERCSQIVMAVAAESGRLIMELQQTGQTSVMLEMTEFQSSPTSDPTAKSNQPPQNSWTFDSPGEPRIRVTIRKINDLRMALLLEESANEKTAWRRKYEIGMTREGERLAEGNTGERECVVTGGLGSISVTHGGKTYFVCCEGCKQAFEADPDGTLAAYRKRQNKKSTPPTE